MRRVIHREGKAEGVSYVDASGQEKLQPADVVVLSSWTINNSRLLLLSGIGEPYDPATRKGTLGKNLTHTVAESVQLYFDKPLNLFMGSGGLGYAIQEGIFAGDSPSVVSAGLLRGSEIRGATIGEGPIAAFGEIPDGEAKSNWGSDWKKAALTWNDKLARITSEAAHMAYRQNYMDLDPSYTDKFGDPLMRLTLDWTDHERRQRAFLADVMKSLGKATGARVGRVLGADQRYSVTHYQSTHVQGGAILGDSPETSVVNPWLQHWRTPNLWITGGSGFPQNDSANPTLTILAVTYRAADAFVDRYLKKPGAIA